MRNASPDPTILSRVTIVGERIITKHIIDVDIASTVLARTVTIRLIAGQGWKPATGQAWPTLYFLHGGDDGPRCWTDKTDIVERVVAANVLAVLPDGGRAGFYTNWRRADNAGNAPQWEHFHLVDLLRLVEQQYGASDVRAVAGVSMGGYGAVAWAAKYPGLFQAAASYSGMLHIRRPGTPSLLRWYLRSVGQRLNAMWGARWLHRRTWANNDPCHLADRLLATPLYLAAGNGTRPPGDEPAPGDQLFERLVGPSTRDLAKRLTRRGHPALHLSYGPGTHAWPSWQRELERSWPFLLAAVGRENTQPAAE